MANAMANISEQKAREELRHAIIELRSRRLDQAAKWAAEQLVGLPPTDECQRSSSTSQAARKKPVSDVYLLAMSHFDHKVRGPLILQRPLSPSFPAPELSAINQIYTSPASLLCRSTSEQLMCCSKRQAASPSFCACTLCTWQERNAKSESLSVSMLLGLYPF